MNAESIGTMAGNALLGLGANGSLLVGSYWIARYGFRQPRGLSAGLATALVFWVACTVGLEVLGSFGALAVGPMLAWGGMVGAIGGVFWWCRAEVDPDPSTAPDRRAPFLGRRTLVVAHAVGQLWYWG